MFVCQKELLSLDLPVQRVVLLQRSLSDVQVALPGLPAQQATAYLCAYGEGKGLRIAAALDLHASRRVVFYLNDEGPLEQRPAQRILHQGAQFLESMGFLLGDLDLQRLRPQERAALWHSLPLRGGAGKEERKADVPPPAPSTPAPAPAAVGAKEVQQPAPARPPSPAAVPRRPPSAGDLAVGRKRLLENLGRFLASL